MTAEPRGGWAGYDFERRSLAAALRGYEDWLRKPVRGFEWGESDCAIVAMEPLIAAGLDRRGATPGASDRGGAR
jgi:hypothetical protein